MGRCTGVPSADIVAAARTQACEELGLAGYPPYGPDSANLNLVLRRTPSDPPTACGRASTSLTAPLDIGVGPK